MRRRPDVLAPWLTVDERLNAQIDAAFSAVAAAFPYFEDEAILFPPRGHCIAALARQCLIHLLVHTFHLPKKHIASLGNARLAKVQSSCRMVEAHRHNPRFAAWFDRLASDAKAAFDRLEADLG